MESDVYIEKLKSVLTKSLRSEWEAQGHNMTGKVIDDIDYVVSEELGSLRISGFMYPYGSIIAAGTSSDKIPYRIPYGGRGKGGGTSMYITALQNYVKARMGISDAKKSLSIAFAIATEQKKYGMPTHGSYKYSSTGKRLKWIDEAFKNNETVIFNAVRELAYNALTVKLDTMITQWQKELNT